LKNKDTFTDRLEAQAKAKQALLEKAKKNDPTSDPEFAARQQARLEAARIREEREAERRRAVQAERERVRAERAAIAAAKAAEADRKAEEARLAAEQARKDAEERARRAVRVAPKPAQLGLKDLKAAIDARTGGK
jgi:colicin import membrane protein